MVGSQYFWTSVSSGNAFYKFASQLLGSGNIAGPGQSKGRHCPDIAVRGQLHRCIGIGARLLAVSPIPPRASAADT